ncbi:hypothetical protein B0H19DRAFT_154065 [Mycena capillaripes]|nr:hypothetical protein B0H19DRAFT_154065 [Mycena capillaripes]
MLAVTAERLLDMLGALVPSKRHNLADDEESQELYRPCMALRPKIVKLIDKYSQRQADLVSMDETFVRARTIFDRMTEESLARPSSGVYYPQQQQMPYGAPAAGPAGPAYFPTPAAGPGDYPDAAAARRPASAASTARCPASATSALAPGAGSAGVPAAAGSYPAQQQPAQAQAQAQGRTPCPAQAQPQQQPAAQVQPQQQAQPQPQQQAQPQPEPQPQAQQPAQQAGPPYVYDPHPTNVDPNVQA